MKICILLSCCLLFTLTAGTAKTSFDKQKNKGRTIFTLAIGNKINEDEIRPHVSSDNHYFHAETDNSPLLELAAISEATCDDGPSIPQVTE